MDARALSTVVSTRVSTSTTSASTSRLHTGASTARCGDTGADGHEGSGS